MGVGVVLEGAVEQASRASVSPSASTHLTRSAPSAYLARPDMVLVTRAVTTGSARDGGRGADEALVLPAVFGGRP